MDGIILHPSSEQRISESDGFHTLLSVSVISNIGSDGLSSVSEEAYPGKSEDIREYFEMRYMRMQKKSRKKKRRKVCLEAHTGPDDIWFQSVSSRRQ